MLELRSVTKTYDGVQVVGPLDLRVLRGQTTVLIGPSGCGKSTLLRMLIGLVEPDRGEVRIEGEVLEAEGIQKQRRRMGYVIQEGGLFPHMNARENATFMARYLGWSEERRRERLEELLALTNFPADGLGRLPEHLSGGQRQRVSLMRALMLNPDILLMDEPLGALDPMIRADLQVDLRRIFRELGKTVVLVTHDLAEAAFFGDHIVLLRQGEIVQEGELDDFIERPAGDFVTDFISAQRSLDIDAS